MTEENVVEEDIWMDVWGTLRFITTDLELDIDSLLGIKGESRITRRGDRIWRYDLFEDNEHKKATEQFKKSPVEKQLLDKAIELLDKKGEIIRGIAAKCVVASVWISYHCSNSQGGFSLPPEFIQSLSKAGIKLDISILSWGD